MAVTPLPVCAQVAGLPRPAAGGRMSPRGTTPQTYARSSYIQALTDYRTAGREFMRGNIPAGKKAVDNATSWYLKYNKVIVDCMGLRPSATSPPS